MQLRSFHLLLPWGEVNKTFSKEDLLLLLRSSICYALPISWPVYMDLTYLTQVLESGIIHHWDTFMRCLMVLCSRRLGAQYLMILPI